MATPAPPQPAPAIGGLSAKLVSVINARFVDYSIPRTFAFLVASTMLAGFVGIFFANLQCTEVVTTSNNWETFSGTWTKQKLNIEKVFERPEGLSENVQIEVDACVINAYVQISWTTQDNHIEFGERLCIFPPTAVMEYYQFPEFLHWCKLEELKPSIQELFEESGGSSDPETSFREGLDGTYPGWACAYKDVLGGDTCHLWDTSQAYRFCGSGLDEGMDWGNPPRYENPIRGGQRPFDLNLNINTRTTVTTCPAPSVAFGAAMGYIGLIELAAMVLLTFPLVLMGCAKPVNPNASLINLFRGAGVQAIEADMKQVKSQVGGMGMKV